MPSSPISPCPSCPPHAAGGHGCAVYSWSVTDAEWAILEPLLPAPGSTAGRGGRPEKHCRRVIADAILDIVRGGIAGRQLPVEFASAATVYAVFARWARSGGVAAHPRRAARPTAGAGRAGPVLDRGDHRLADGTRRRQRAPIQPRLGWRQANERRQAAHRGGWERPAARRRRHRRLDPGPRRRTPTPGRTARQLLHHPAGLGPRRLPRTVAHLGERRSHPYYADHQTHPRRHWFPRPAPHLGGREKFRVDQQAPPLRARLRNRTRRPRSHGPPRHDHDHDQATRPNLTVFKHPLNRIGLSIGTSQAASRSSSPADANTLFHISASWSALGAFTDPRSGQIGAV